MKAIALLILIGVIILSLLLSKVEAFADLKREKDSFSLKREKDDSANTKYDDIKKESDAAANAKYNKLTRMTPTPEGPYSRDPINDVDEYDVQFVDQQTSWRKINDRTAKELTRRNRLAPDWSELPPDANQFQIKRQDFVEGVYNKPILTDDDFKKLEGGDVQPPDQTKLDAEEAKLMATYAPEHSKSLTKYSIEDAKDFIKKFYDRQGKVPEIVEDPKFPNVYQVVSVQDKNPKIIWETAAPSSPDAVEDLGENTINVPQVAVDRADPFFFGEGKGYKAWTPGLERMFAPTFAKSSWY